MAPTLTTPTTVWFFLRDPTPTLEAESEWQLPLLPQLPSVFRETPSHPWSWIWMATTLYHPNYLQFLKRPQPYSVIILFAWYTIWVSILIKSIVLSLFLAFITLSDLYYPHHPPPEGCTFRSRKKGILYIQCWKRIVYFVKAVYESLKRIMCSVRNVCMRMWAGFKTPTNQGLSRCSKIYKLQFCEKKAVLFSILSEIVAYCFSYEIRNRFRFLLQNSFSRKFSFTGNSTCNYYPLKYSF